MRGPVETPDHTKQSWWSRKFHRDLTLQFGVACGQCDNEDEFLDVVLELVEEFRGYEKEDLSDIFFENVPDIKSFRKVLSKISVNVNTIKSG